MDLLASTPTPEQILAYHPSEALQTRLSDLLERNRNGLLSKEDNAELDDFSRMNHFMSMMKIRARKRIAS